LNRNPVCGSGLYTGGLHFKGTIWQMCQTDEDFTGRPQWLLMQSLFSPVVWSDQGFFVVLAQWWKAGYIELLWLKLPRTGTLPAWFALHTARLPQSWESEDTRTQWYCLFKCPSVLILYPWITSNLTQCILIWVCH
jgi:hypothetical protein